MFLDLVDLVPVVFTINRSWIPLVLVGLDRSLVGFPSAVLSIWVVRLAARNVESIRSQQQVQCYSVAVNCAVAYNAVLVHSANEVLSVVNII